MKDYEGIVLLILGLCLAAAIYTGFTTFIKKSFSSHPKEKIHNSDQMLDEQRRLMRENEIKQKQMIRDQKQKTNDLKRLHRNY